VDLWTKPKFCRNRIGGLQSVKIWRIFRQPNYFLAAVKNTADTANGDG